MDYLKKKKQNIWPLEQFVNAFRKSRIIERNKYFLDGRNESENLPNSGKSWTVRGCKVSLNLIEGMPSRKEKHMECPDLKKWIALLRRKNIFSGAIRNATKKA